MKKTTVIMSPTINIAVYEWKEFLSRWSMIIKKANRTNLYAELLNGHKIYFKGETEGQRALRGLHADIIMADEITERLEDDNFFDFDPNDMTHMFDRVTEIPKDVFKGWSTEEIREKIKESGTIAG